MTEADRLRKHLRAVTALNHQLQAQLDGHESEAPGGPPVSGAVAQPPSGRRRGTGDAWIRELERLPYSDQPIVVQEPKGTIYLLDAGARRRIGSGIVAAAVEAHVGPRRLVSAEAVGDLPDAPPVEVLEGPHGPPFVVFGGRRHPLRGLPLPHPVAEDQLQAFPEGVELQLTATEVLAVLRKQASRKRRLERRWQNLRARRGGTVPALVAVGRRGVRKVKRDLRR